MAHAACATHKTDCSRTYDTMAVQLCLERCGVVLLDRSRGGTAPGSQPQRSPTSATDCDSDPSGLTIDGQSRANGQQALRIVQWNAEGVRLKKTELQHFLKLKAIDVCCIQETHLSSSHLFFIRGYEVFRQDRAKRPKGGLLTLVRNNIPAAEIQRSGQADLDTEYLGVKLVLAGTPVSVFIIYSPPDKQIQLHNIKVEPQSWIITGDFNSHSPSWGYGQLNSKEAEVENWITENRLILINKPDDPDTFYSRTWRTTSTPDLAIATDDIQGIAEREVSSQLGGSDHRPVIISIKGQTQPHKNKLPASWNYEKGNWDAVREAVDRKTAVQEEPSQLPPHQSTKLRRQICWRGWLIGDSSTTWRATMCYLQRRQATGSTEAQRTNLPTLPRTSKMHSRKKGRFWQSSSISQMHLTRSGKRDFL